MSEKTIHIDPEQFAYHFANTIDTATVSQDQIKDLVKKELFAYLSAYVMAEKFNNSEASEFVNRDQREIDDLSMGEFLKLITQKSSFSPKI